MGHPALGDLPGALRERAETSIADHASFVHVTCGEALPLFDDTNEVAYRVHAIQGDFLVTVTLTARSDGSIQERAEAIARGRIVTVEVTEGMPARGDGAALHILDLEAGDGSTYTCFAPAEVGRALIQAG